jgi:hypothetical protein
MADELSPNEMETLKSRFSAAECVVTPLDDSTFEVVSDDFPVQTHVYATPYFLQLSTNILAKPEQAVPIERVRELLCAINLKAHLVKFTMEAEKPDEQTGAWPILASAKLVTGAIGGDYPASAIKNMFLIWLQDIATLMAEPPDLFEVHPMMDLERLHDD